MGLYQDRAELIIAASSRSFFHLSLLTLDCTKGTDRFFWRYAAETGDEAGEFRIAARMYRCSKARAILLSLLEGSTECIQIAEKIGLDEPRLTATYLHEVLRYAYQTPGFEVVDDPSEKHTELSVKTPPTKLQL